MAIKMQKIIDKWASQGKRLLLIDALGALLTTFSVGVILVKFETAFGMPRKVLYWLSLVAGIYSIYSFFCYYFTVNNWRPYLKAIAIANGVYCGFTAFLIFYFYQSLTTLGVIYFSLEIIVMSCLIFIELRVK